MGSSKVAIIGAGLAGLVAARRLVELESQGRVDVAGDDIVLLERSSAAGGRLATERIGEAVLDHGAQFFTVRTDDLRADVARWQAEGVVEEWCRGFGEIDGYPRYRVAGGMVQLANHLVEELVDRGVAVIAGAPVEAIEARTGDDDGDGWRIGFDDGRTPLDVDAVIATPPVPMSLALLACGGVAVTDAAATLDGFAYHRVVALLTVLDRSPELPSPGALQQPGDETFSFVSDNQAKGISPVPAVTFHTAHARSADLWPASDDEILHALLPAARQVVTPAEIDEVRVVRWLHTGPVAAHPDPCVVAATGSGSAGPVVLAGDGFGGSKVEGAYTSGRAAAVAVAEGLRSA